MASEFLRKTALDPMGMEGFNIIFQAHSLKINYNPVETYLSLVRVYRRHFSKRGPRVCSSSKLAYNDFASRILMYHYDLDFGHGKLPDKEKLSMIKEYIEEASSLLELRPDNAYYYPSPETAEGHFNVVKNFLSNQLEFVESKGDNFNAKEKVTFCSQSRDIFKTSRMRAHRL